MDELQCVMDAELFEKFKSNRGQIPIDELLKEGYKEEDKRECKCLNGFLEAITLNKCTAFYNQKILKKYSNLIKKLPNELNLLLWAIITNEDHFKELDEPFKHGDKDSIKNTDLENKLQYISVAYYLKHHRIIISTKNDIEGCYRKYPDKMMLFRIDCKNVCDALGKIK